MKAVGEQLRKANSNPISLMLNGEVIQLQVWVKNLIYDGPEARKAALVLSACTECLATRNDMALPMRDSLMDARTTTNMMAQFKARDFMIANKAHEKCCLDAVCFIVSDACVLFCVECTL